MKIFLTLLLSALSAFASTITGPVGDLSGSAFNPRVEFWPLSTPFNIGNTNIVGPPKTVPVVSGNFSQVLVAGRYLVKFPPTTNSFYIHVPNDTATYSLAAVSTNVSSVTGIASAPVYRVRVTIADTNAGFLSSKLVAGSGVTITTNSAGQDETLTITAAGGSTYTNNTGLPGVVLGSGIGTNMTTLATQAGLAAGSYAVNGVSITNLYPIHLNQSLLLNSNIKLANNCQTYNLPNVFSVFGIGDNAVPAVSGGASFSSSIARGLSSFLPYAGSIFGGYDSSGGVFYSAGTATYVGGSGNNAVWHGGYWTYATGNAVTNTSTDAMGVNATHLVLNCVQASGFGSFQVYTGRVGAALALFKTVDNNNGGAWTAYTTNCWLGGYKTNIIAAVVSTGTNISYGQIACGLYSTNVSGYIFDPNFIGSADIERCMTNSTHSNAVAVLLKPYFDAVIWSDLNYSNAIYAGAKSFNNMLLPSASASSWHTDFCLLTGSPDTNNPAVASSRSAALRVGFDYEIPVFDSYSFLYPNTPARLYGLVPSADVHFTNYVGKMIGTKLVDWLGWSWSHQLVNGYVGLMSLPYIAKTNGTAYETFTVVTTNSFQVVVKAVSADNTGLWMGLAAGTTLTSGNAKLMGDNTGVTVLNASSGKYIFNSINGTPYYYLAPSGGTVLGTVYDNTADPGAGKVRFNGDASFSGNIYASNSIAISTNFVGANFTPVSAFTKISGSNNAAYGITSAKTNLISAP